MRSIGTSKKVNRTVHQSSSKIGVAALRAVVLTPSALSAQSHTTTFRYWMEGFTESKPKSVRCRKALLDLGERCET